MLNDRFDFPDKKLMRTCLLVPVITIDCPESDATEVLVCLQMLEAGKQFSRIKNLQNTCKCLCNIQRSLRDFYSYDGELKDTLVFSSLLVC